MVLFADLCQRSLQVEDLLVLLLELFRDGDLLFERDALLAVVKSGFVQRVDQVGGLVEGRALSWHKIQTITII